MPGECCGVTVAGDWETDSCCATGDCGGGVAGDCLPGSCCGVGDCWGTLAAACWGAAAGRTQWVLLGGALPQGQDLLRVQVAEAGQEPGWARVAAAAGAQLALAALASAEKGWPCSGQKVRSGWFWSPPT